MNQHRTFRWILTFAVAASLWGQAGRFTAVSIRPNNSGNPSSDTETAPGRISYLNVTPISLLLRAFSVLRPQIIGAPDWATSERYDVIAVTEGNDPLGDRQRGPYIEAMLAERWQLRYHRETRPLDVLSLQPVRGGHKLRVHTANGVYAMKVRQANGRQILESTRGNIPRLVEILSGAMGAIVVDDTSLNGAYDFTLEWVQDLNSDAAGPALTTALQEQLGLTLQRVKRPTEVIVVDGFERPSEN